MIRAQRAGPAQEVRQTGLMERLGEAAIGRPAVPHQDAVEVGAEVDAGGPQRVRGLQGVPPLHAATTLRASADGHLKALDDWPDDGEVLLILRRDAQQVQRAPTPRTGLGERGVVSRIDAGGNGAARPAPVAAAGPPPRPPAAALRPSLGERRGLAEPGAPRGREQLCEALVLALQPIALTLQPFALTLQPIALVPCPRQLLAQPRDLFVLVADPFIAIVVVGRARSSATQDLWQTRAKSTSAEL